MVRWLFFAAGCAIIGSLILTLYGAHRLDERNGLSDARRAGHRAFWIALPTTASLVWVWATHVSGYLVLSIESAVLLMTWSGLNELRARLRDIGARFW